MKFTTMKLFEKILVIAAVAAAAMADDSEISSGEGLDANELPPNNTADFETVPHDLKVFEELESLEEKKSSCSPTISCTRAGGKCVKSKDKCTNGVLDASGCKGGKKCKCCIQDKLERKINILYDKLDHIIDDIERNTNTLDDKLTYVIAFLNNSLESEDTTTPIPTTTTPNPTITTTPAATTDPGCPEGFFQTNGSSQCFIYFNDVKRDWSASKSKCSSEGLQMAIPEDPVAVRLYLQKTYGNGDGWPYVWIDAKGDGSVFRWQRNNQAISNSSPFWKPGFPGSRISSNYCIMLLNKSDHLGWHPTKPYWSELCSTGCYAFCESV